MVDTALVLAIFGGFIGGLLTLSRVGRWVHGLSQLARATRTVPAPTAGVWLAGLFLHSGLWLLVVATAISCYVTMHAPRDVFWGFLGGIGAALSLVILWVVAARLRPAVKPTEHVPLTPADLKELRDRFIPSCTWFGGILGGVSFSYFLQDIIPSSFWIYVMVFVGWLGWGYVMALFFWEKRKGELQARDSAWKRAQKGPH